MKPLTGKTIVDFSRYAPGPYASLVCAALGASVIKIEAPGGGDPLRDLDPAAFDRLNAGKKSVVVDLKTGAGRNDVLRLIDTADVLIESFRPGVMDRLGLGYDALASRARSLAYVSISGYGQTGPHSKRSGHDVNYMALAGALDRVETPLAFQFADFAAGGLFAVVAILSTLQEGRSRYIDLSMHDGLLALGMLTGGTAALALSGRFANYHLYKTKDGRSLSVGALEPVFWDAFCRGIGRPDFATRADDPRLCAEVAEVIACRTAAEWEERLKGFDACVELVLTGEEAVAHPQAGHRNREGALFRLPYGLESVELERAPNLGEHNGEIL